MVIGRRAHMLEKEVGNFRNKEIVWREWDKRSCRVQVHVERGKLDNIQGNVE